MTVRMDPVLLFMIFLVAVAALFAMFRFAGNHYGELRINADVGKAFESGQVRERLRYYTSGPDGSPHAIMGLDRDWILNDGLWKPFDMTPMLMKTLVDGMAERGQTLHGFDMVDHRGQKIGEMFSILGIQTTILMGRDNRVDIETPPVDTYPQF